MLALKFFQTCTYKDTANAAAKQKREEGGDDENEKDKAASTSIIAWHYRVLT